MCLTNAARRRNGKFEVIYKIYHKIIDRLPSTYPRAALVVHRDVKELREYYFASEDITENDVEYLPEAFCDGLTYTIHIPLTLYTCPIEEIAWYYLHEIGHLYALSRYGENNPKWSGSDIAEKYADKFAYRWLNKIQREGIIKP